MFYLNQTRIIIKKEKNLIQEEASKFSASQNFVLMFFSLRE